MKTSGSGKKPAGKKPNSPLRDETRSPARQVATSVVHRVLEDEAFTAAVLDAALAREKLARNDAALATELSFGTLRAYVRLRGWLEPLLRQPFDKLEGWVRASLLVAAYQLFYLPRIPTFAIVAESVALVKKKRGPGLAALSNAILRKLAAERETWLARAAESPRLALPSWIQGALEASIGAEALAQWVEGSGNAPWTGLRAQSARISREALAERLRQERPDAEIRLGSFARHALLVRRAGPLQQLESYREGLFTVQEEGAQLVIDMAAFRQGERAADLCAGRGNKTTQIAEAVGSAGEVLAADYYEEKLAQLERELLRLQMQDHRVEWHAVDLSRGTGKLRAERDRVVVDAPCTGLGTLHRRPELMLRLDPASIASMQALQIQILSRAATLVRRGGCLIYAVCSPLREEGAGTIETFLRQSEAAWRPLLEPFLLRDKSWVPDELGGFCWGPWSGEKEGGTDAYQVYRLTRR